MEAPPSPQRGQAHGEAKDKERWGRRGREKGQEEVEDGWEVRGEGSDFRGAVDWGRREGRGGSRLTSPAGERRDPERREYSCTGDRRV